MIEHIGLHPTKPTHLIDDLLMKREQCAQLHPALAVTSELAIGPHEFRIGGQERKTSSLSEALWRQLAMKLIQYRLVRKELELARSSCHEQKDHILDLWRQMELAKRSQGLGVLLGHQRL